MCPNNKEPVLVCDLLSCRAKLWPQGVTVHPKQPVHTQPPLLMNCRLFMLKGVSSSVGLTLIWGDGVWILLMYLKQTWPPASLLLFSSPLDVSLVAEFLSHHSVWSFWCVLNSTRLLFIVVICCPFLADGHSCPLPPVCLGYSGATCCPDV